MSVQSPAVLCFLAVLCLWSAALESQAHAVTPLSGEVVAWEVAAWKVPCSYGESYHGMCLQVRKAGETAWELMPDVIKDFKHVWGHGYQVRVLVHTPNPATLPEDARSTEEFLMGVDADTAVAPGTTFTAILDATHQPLGWVPLYSVDPDFKGGQLIDGQRFVCADIEHCKTLHAATNRSMAEYSADSKTPRAFKATFAFPASPKIPLQLMAIAPVN